MSYFKVIDIYKLDIHVGTLYHNNDNEYWMFKYDIEECEKLENGAWEMNDFPVLDRVYEKRYLFPYFEGRIVSKERPDIRRILDEEGLYRYSRVDLLRKINKTWMYDKFEFRYDE